MSATIDHPISWLDDNLRLNINSIVESVLLTPGGKMPFEQMVQLPMFAIYGQKKAQERVSFVTRWARALGCLSQVVEKASLVNSVFQVPQYGSMDIELDDVPKPWQGPFPKQVSLIDKMPKKEPVPVWLKEIHSNCWTQYTHLNNGASTLRSVYFDIQDGKLRKPNFRIGAYLVWLPKITKDVIEKTEERVINEGSIKITKASSDYQAWLKASVKNLYEECEQNRSTISTKLAVLELANKISMGKTVEITKTLDKP